MFKLPFQNHFQKIATDKLGSALKESFENAFAEAKESADLDDNGVGDYIQLIDSPDVGKPSALQDIVGGLTQAATVGGFKEFIVECQEFSKRLSNPKMKEGVERAIRGATTIYEYVQDAAGKFLPKKIAEGIVAEEEAAQA